MENYQLLKNKLQLHLSKKQKKDKDKRFITNWRHILLINVDAKIASKALAKRLQKVLPHINKEDQHAYVEGRSIYNAVRNIYDIMEFTQDEDLPRLRVALDFEKAFDSLSRRFLSTVLEKFNFGPSFISWVRTMNNGFASNYFPISRGVRQGELLSAYLFIIALEVLLIKIRADSSISGIKVKSEEIKLCVFADDLTCLLDGKQSFFNLSQVSHVFSLCSGLKLNKKKTETLWLGNKRDTGQALPGIILSDKLIKILGIYFTYDKVKRKEYNFDLILKEIKRTLICWRWRNLTLFGRIQIVKTFIIPKVMHRASLIQIDKGTIKEANTLIYNFIRNGKDKIKRLALINDYENGGLKAPHLESVIQAHRIRCIEKFLRINDENHSIWKTIPSYYLNRVASRFLFQCNFSVDKLSIGLPAFYDLCIREWEIFKNSKVTPLNKLEIFDEIIWNNQSICIDGKSAYNSKLVKGGILKISDITNACGGLRKWNDLKKSYPILTAAEFFFLAGIYDSLPD